MLALVIKHFRYAETFRAGPKFWTPLYLSQKPLPKRNFFWSLIRPTGWTALKVQGASYTECLLFEVLTKVYIDFVRSASLLGPKLSEDGRHRLLRS